jgi:hypothetical protein
VPVVHSLVDMFAICCGYEDADDLDHLWSDPVDAWMAHLADYGCPLRRDVRNRSAILMGAPLQL